MYCTLNLAAIRSRTRARVRRWSCQPEAAGRHEPASPVMPVIPAEDRALCEHAASVLGRWLEKHP